MFKKVLCILSLCILCFCGSVLAERNIATVNTYSSSQLIKGSGGFIYSISFVATSNGGNFIIYDETTLASIAGDNTSIKAEGSEVSSLGSLYQDFSNKPLRFTTGIYLSITNGYVVLHYE